MEIMEPIFINNITPADINIKERFWDSVFQNLETETVLRNIVMIQKIMGRYYWSSFSWEDYKNHCNHVPNDIEKHILDCLVDGGKPVWSTSCHIQPGYLLKSDIEKDTYIMTDKLLDVLSKYKYC